MLTYVCVVLVYQVLYMKSTRCCKNVLLGNRNCVAGQALSELTPGDRQNGWNRKFDTGVGAILKHKSNFRNSIDSRCGDCADEAS